MGGKMEFMTKWGKRLIVAGAITGGVIYCGVLGYRRMVVSTDELSSDENNEIREIYARIQQNSFTTVVNLMVPLKDVITQELNTESITSQLKENPSNKLVLWENLKYTSFSRAVVCTCVSSMLTVLVKVQLSIIAGFHCYDGNNLTSEKQKLYLTTMHKSFEKGIAQLVKVINSATENVLVSYSLKHQMSLDLICDLLNNILEQASNSQRLERNYWLINFIVPDIGSSTDNNIINDLLMATEDVLEIKDTHDILQTLLERSLTNFSRSLTESFHSAAQSSQTLPLARVIPLISDHSLLQFDEQHHKLIQEMINNIDLMSCCRNIFEAFSR